jgi:hypothetical protein
MSKTRQSLPYQCFANAMRDRNAYRVRNDISLLTSPPEDSRDAAPPKHNTPYVSLARMVQRLLAEPDPVRLWVIFRLPTGSAKLSGDKHNNFIGLKNVPAPIAISRSPRH